MQPFFGFGQLTGQSEESEEVALSFGNLCCTFSNIFNILLLFKNNQHIIIQQNNRVLQPYTQNESQSKLVIRKCKHQGAH